MLLYGEEKGLLVCELGNNARYYLPEPVSGPKKRVSNTTMNIIFFLTFCRKTVQIYLSFQHLRYICIRKAMRDTQSN